MNSAKLDREAQALVKLLDGFDAFNMELVTEIQNELLGKGKSGADIIAQHFTKKPNKGGNIPKLEPETIKAKKTGIKLVERGDLKKATLKGQKPKIKRSGISYTADVPDYGEYLHKGIKTKSGLKKFKFFNIFRNELPLFNKMVETVFNHLLRKKGVM